MLVKFKHLYDQQCMSTWFVINNQLLIKKLNLPIENYFFHNSILVWLLHLLDQSIPTHLLPHIWLYSAENIYFMFMSNLKLQKHDWNWISQI